MLSSYLCGFSALNMEEKHQQQKFPFLQHFLPPPVSLYYGPTPDLFSWHLKNTTFQSLLHKLPLCLLCYFLLYFYFVTLSLCLTL